MFTDRIEGSWIAAFAQVLELCKIKNNETIAVLYESQSRELNVHLTELALGSLGLKFFGIKVPTPVSIPGPIIRSSGACQALNGQNSAVSALCACDVVIDLTLEGLMHAPQTAQILKSGTRILNISNEHPEALARLVPQPDLKDMAKASVSRCRASKTMTVRSEAGTDLTIGHAGCCNRWRVGLDRQARYTGPLAGWNNCQFPQGG